ncbi:MAG: HTH domain-containing protein [Bacteroidota bacterium]|nr:HTH domain-containing protein [Bacteroidota bacterium]
MDYLTYSEKLESMQYYIKSRSAVTVTDLSNKLEVSRRTVLRMVENLRLQGIDLQYCKKQKAYSISAPEKNIFQKNF